MNRGITIRDIGYDVFSVSGCMAGIKNMFDNAKDTWLSKSYTATDLFNYLQKHYPAAMRGVTPNRLGRMMIALGVQRIHTEYGNVYRLVKLKDSSAA